MLKYNVTVESIHSFKFHGSLQVTELYGYENSQQKQYNTSQKHNIINNINIINNTYLLIISSCHTDIIYSYTSAYTVYNNLD